MNEDKLVAAIEISSSKIIAAVGRLRPNGQLDIIACEQEQGVESVRYGVIKNPEDTSLRIQRVIDRLELHPAVSPYVITGVFVGLAGQSLRTIPTEVTRNLPEDTEIDDEIIESLRDMALRTAIDSSLEVVDAVPRVFRIGKSVTTSPKGEIGNSISATVDLVVCRPELKRNLSRTLTDKLDIRIEGALVTALTASKLILTTEEKRLGCMLVDMGAETTTVTIYKDGALRYFVTLPMGGRNITRDIMSLKYLEERAEDIKITSGSAIARENATNLNFNGVRESDISNLVVARSEEIVVNIIEQIHYAGLSEQDLPGGIVCIGGAARLSGMLELLSDRSELGVRRGQLPNYIRIEDTKAPTLEIIEVASVLYVGATNSDCECLEKPEAEDLPVTGSAPHPAEQIDSELTERKPKKPNKWMAFKEKFSSFFAGGEDDSDLLDN